jgi:pyrophosphatase PpaX
MPHSDTRLALLFDLDGTLIDSIGLLLACMHDAFADRPRRPSDTEWTAGIGTPLREQLAPWCHGPDDVEQLVARYRDYQDRHLEGTTAPYPGVRDTLHWARSQGHALGLVTSKGRGMTTRSLRHLDIADWFDTVVTVEDTARHKPHPDPVRHALAQLAIPHTRALFVGDSPHDMHAGRAAGVLTAAAQWGPFSREQLAPATPTYWLTSMSQLPDTVAHMRRDTPTTTHA